jgi:hypothetical protein
MDEKEYSGNSGLGLLDALQPVSYILKGSIEVENDNGRSLVKFTPLTIYSDFITKEDVANEINTLEYDGYRILRAIVDVYCVYFNNSKEYLKTFNITLN